MIRLKGNENSWGLIAKIFHWTIALLLFWQVGTGISLHNMEFSPLKIGIIGSHKIFGTIIFTLIVLRLLWRFYNNHPKYESLPQKHKIISSLVHAILYFLVVVIPVQGTYMTWLGGSDVSMFGLIEIPSFVDMDFILYQKHLEIHYYSAIILTSVFTLHILAALYHRFIIKDKYGVWKRMVSRQKKV